MLQIFPDYFKDFKCVAGDCQHSCCIGWEIDIDPETASYYRGIQGELGRRLRENIAWEDPPHFILGEGDRCPFLNRQGLCDIILTLGEDHICGICTEHPRFHNQLPGRLESGLGLCCEEAARLILSQKEPVRLELHGEDDGRTDKLITLRDRVIALLQQRELTIPERIGQMLQLCDIAPPPEDFGMWMEFLTGLERLDEAWTGILALLGSCEADADLSDFDKYMSLRQTEYEQFLVYLIYRHMANAFDEGELALRARFAAFSYALLRRIGGIIYTQTGEFSFEQQVQLARMFSSEIEYSPENLELLLDELAFL